MATASPGAQDGNSGRAVEVLVVDVEVEVDVVVLTSALLLAAMVESADDVWVASQVIHRPAHDATRTTTSVSPTSQPFIARST